MARTDKGGIRLPCMGALSNTAAYRDASPDSLLVFVEGRYVKVELTVREEDTCDNEVWLDARGARELFNWLGVQLHTADLVEDAR